MKTRYFKLISKGSTVIASAAALLLSSCYVPYGGYYGGGGAVVATGGGAVVATGGNTMVDWVDASYDTTGYPIYGYSYGRPVYGYTDAGVAIFTIAALSAVCFIPDWGAASWCHHAYHRPPGRPYARPPRYARGHHPQNRPRGGMNADVHRNPTKYTHKKGPSNSHNIGGNHSSRINPSHRAPSGRVQSSTHRAASTTKVRTTTARTSTSRSSAASRSHSVGGGAGRAAGHGAGRR